MASFTQMARSVGELVDLKRRQLAELEELTYRLGVEPGPDLAFAGIRVVVAAAAEAQKLLSQLAPYEPEALVWLAERMKLDKAAGTASSAVS